MEEEEVRPAPAEAFPRNLEPLSVEALHQYLAELEAESARVRREIAAKQALRAGAEGLFGKR